MTADEWRRTRDLFERALEEEPADLHAWLAREAPDHASIRAEVASLLDHHTRAEDFLSQPIGGSLDDLTDDEPRFDPGQAIGPYTVVREVGRGGMGRVYQATDGRLGRTVALKALPAAFARRPDQRERLRREARAAAGLTHPGICTIYALEEIDDELFIVSEFVEGQTLREVIRSGERPSPASLLATARELAAALASAHTRGITHRDLKPENVMRSVDGRLKILDFGLALIDPATAGQDHANALTAAGVLVGTPAYMAPEQLNGGVVDPRADVFAYGVMLYEYATGTHPFDAPTPLARMARVLEGAAVPVTDLRSDLDRRLTTVLATAMRRQPGDRFGSAAEIVAALDAPVLVPSPAPAPANVPWWRTHQVAAIVLYFCACAVAWQNKEWQHGITDPLFVLVSIAATTAAVFRGHLLFTERTNRHSLSAERHRAAPVTLVADVTMAVILGVDGSMLAAARPLFAVLTIGLAIGIVIARAVVEPATTAAAFGGTTAG